jgi:hypothetical protein
MVSVRGRETVTGTDFRIMSKLDLFSRDSFTRLSAIIVEPLYWIEIVMYGKGARDGGDRHVAG